MSRSAVLQQTFDCVAKHGNGLKQPFEDAAKSILRLTNQRVHTTNIRHVVEALTELKKRGSIVYHRDFGWIAKLEAEPSDYAEASRQFRRQRRGGKRTTEAVARMTATV